MSKANKKRFFTQKELEKHIAARLIRERKSNQALISVKEILDSLMKEGLINANSYAEAAGELYKKLSEKNVGNMREDGDDAVRDENADVAEETCGKSDANDNEVSADTQESFADNDVQDKEDKDATLDFPVSEVYPALPENNVRCDDGCNTDSKGDELYELMEKHPELEVAALFADKGFICYCKRYKGSLSELYEGYKGLLASLGELKDCTEVVKRERTNARSAMASTAFSRYSASPDADAGISLSPMQRDIARRAGLTYREYADMLRDIPDGKRQRRSQG